jgi:fibulin 1/2
MLKCGDGFRINPSGTYCEDVDECLEGTHDCPANEVCRNRPGSFVCDCPTGYERNFTTSASPTGTCEDIDECSGYRKFQSCSQSSECENTIGSYVCNCKAGFKQAEDGKTCTGYFDGLTQPFAIDAFQPSSISSIYVSAVQPWLYPPGRQFFTTMSQA